MKMDDLAARCQMSKRTLYRLFPSTRDIFAVIADGHRQSMLGLPFDDDSVDLPGALRHIFQLDIDESEHISRMAMMRMFKKECPNSEEMTGILREQAHDTALATSPNGSRGRSSSAACAAFRPRRRRRSCWTCSSARCSRPTERSENGRATKRAALTWKNASASSSKGHAKKG